MGSNIPFKFLYFSIRSAAIRSSFCSGSRFIPVESRVFKSTSLARLSFSSFFSRYNLAEKFELYVKIFKNIFKSYSKSISHKGIGSIIVKKSRLNLFKSLNLIIYGGCAFLVINGVLRFKHCIGADL